MIGCALCALKHIAMSEGYLEEAWGGAYTLHYWKALGQLSLAEGELLKLNTPQAWELADAIRKERKELEQYPKYSVAYDELLGRISSAFGYDARKVLGRKEPVDDIARVREVGGPPQGV